MLHSWPARSSRVLLDRHEPRRGRVSSVGTANNPLHAFLVPQPNLGGPRARLDLVQRPAPAADRAPRSVGPRAEALAEVIRADRPLQAAQRPLLAPHHPAHRPFQSHHIGNCATGQLRPPRLQGRKVCASVEPATLGGGRQRRVTDRRACRGPRVGRLGSVSSLLDVELDGRASRKVRSPPVCDALRCTSLATLPDPFGCTIGTAWMSGLSASLP
jgi:hypothetical protein